jgi:hypothetical protein
MEIVAEVDDLEALVGRDARNVAGDDVQQHDALVQHLVVLEIVQQRNRHHIDPAGQIDGGARHPRLAVNLGDELAERQGVALELAQQRGAALPPRRHGEVERRADDQRHPAAFKHFHHVGGDKRQIDHGEQARDRDAQRQAPTPYLAHGQKHQKRGQQHGQRDRNAECRSEILR